MTRLARLARLARLTRITRPSHVGWLSCLARPSRVGQLRRPTARVLPTASRPRAADPFPGRPLVLVARAELRHRGAVAVPSTRIRRRAGH